MTTIKIKGMSCQHCVSSVKEALERIETISDVNVDLENGSANYSGDADPDEVRSVIEDTGFEVVD